MNQLSALANKLKVNVNKILLLSQDKLVTDQHVINFTPLMRSSWPGVKIGAGTNYNFTELNRNRFDAGVMDFISFSIHPQEHAFDNQSLIENIEGQSEVVKSLHQLYPDKSIHISPLTLRKRFNPYSTDPGAKIITNEERADPRQKVQFGSLFTMGSIKALSEAKVDAITLFQTAGNQGVVSEEGNPYPVYTLLHELRDKPYHFIGTKSSNTLKAEAILLEWQGIRKLILMNYTHENLALQMDNIVYELLPSSVLIKLIK